MHLRVKVITVSLLLLGACGGSDASEEPRLDAPAPVADAATADASLDGPALDLRFQHDWSEAELCAVADSPGSFCCESPRRELPEVAAAALDLRGLTSGAAGTCGDPVKLLLPGEASAYPLMVLLPEVEAEDPSCAVACGGRERDTLFGIVLELPGNLVDEYRPVVVAPPPWRYVYGHNSLATDMCLAGYQEFGERACVRLTYGGSIGFATGSTTPARAALIELEAGENGQVESCCPYLPTQR